MIIIDDLINVTADVASLENYLTDNFQRVYDYINNTNHKTLLEHRSKIKKYIEINRVIILQLNVVSSINLSFVSLLLDVSERLGLINSFRFLFEHLQKNNYNIGSRLKAASLYLIGITSVDDYLNRYGDIYSLLQIADDTEEDNSDKVLLTLINYYAEVVHNFGNFNIDAVKTLQSKIKASIDGDSFSFANSAITKSVLSVDLSIFNLAYQQIHTFLDNFLGRGVPGRSYKKEFLLERDTDYTAMLGKISPTFNGIRGISVAQYRLIANDSLFRSLQRGVKVLEHENELYAYMNSYGNMHHAKLVSAFELLPKSLYDKELHIIDWGCGQGMGAMVFLDYLMPQIPLPNIKSFTLVEPSEIAIKRASAHVLKYSPKSQITTINKDIDSLAKYDFDNKKKQVKLHIFSNILDVDLYSLTQLIDLIKSTFTGENYFVVVSPYINDIKNGRVDSFVAAFSKCVAFERIKTLNNTTGDWSMSGKDWTRIVRIFKALI